MLRHFSSATMQPTRALTAGETSTIVGKAITNENSHARSQGRATRADRPRFRIVMTSDITPDISSDMQSAKTIPRYLAESMDRRSCERICLEITFRVNAFTQKQPHDDCFC